MTYKTYVNITKLKSYFASTDQKYFQNERLVSLKEILDAYKQYGGFELSQVYKQGELVFKVDENENIKDNQELRQRIKKYTVDNENRCYNNIIKKNIDKDDSVAKQAKELNGIIVMSVTIILGFFSAFAFSFYFIFNILNINSIIPITAISLLFSMLVLIAEVYIACRFNLSS
ncbi:hypothetical protein A3Q56_03354 [Intoshia linei]|uniref:Uncharacterized protein n=1 Tax=Intoshia linei TaxID=1819745 RepID=A0A177B3P1_9BILA|nr:hypothetical protein A3Q56_03354 [Intoshia linei]